MRPGLFWLVNQEGRQSQQHAHAHHVGGSGEKDAGRRGGVQFKALQRDRNQGAADAADDLLVNEYLTLEVSFAEQV